MNRRGHAADVLEQLELPSHPSRFRRGREPWFAWWPVGPGLPVSCGDAPLQLQLALERDALIGGLAGYSSSNFTVDAGVTA